MLSTDLNSSNALRHPLFLQWILGFSVGAVGLWMTRLTLGFVVWELTESPALTGLTAFLILAMPGILGPFVGVWVENIHPKRVVVVVQAFNLALYLMLAVIAYSGTQSVVPYLLVSGATGLLVALWQPARLVMPTVLVPDVAIASAVAVNSMTFNTARIIGPAIAAWVIAWGGPPLAFLFGFVLYAIFLVAALFLRVLPKESTPSGGTFIDRLLGGFAEVAKDRLLILAMSASTFSGFFGRSIIELLPAINGQMIENGTAQSLGLVTSASGFGAIVMGAALATKRGSAQAMLGFLFFGGIVGGGAVAAMALSSSVWHLLPLTFLAGAAGSLTLIGSQASILQIAPKNFRTRIMALWGAMAFGGMGFGGVASGFIASAIGLPVTLMAFGLVGAAGSAGLWIYAWRAQK